MRDIKFRGRNYDGMWMYGYFVPTPKHLRLNDYEYSVCAAPLCIEKFIEDVNFGPNCKMVG